MTILYDKFTITIYFDVYNFIWIFIVENAKNKLHFRDSSQKELTKVYKNASEGWSGILWPGNHDSPPVWTEECQWKHMDDCK